MTDRSDQPKYLHVAAALRRAIRAGTYPVGSELPSTSKLTESFGVSTTVVRAAVRELRDEGLVRGQPGKAVYVTAEPDGESTNSADVEERLRDLEARVTALESRQAD